MLNNTFHCDDNDGANDLHCRFEIPIGNGLFRNEVISLRDALDNLAPRVWFRSAEERANDLARYAVQADERAAAYNNSTSFMADMERKFARQYHAEAAAWREIADNPDAFPHLY